MKKVLIIASVILIASVSGLMLWQIFAKSKENEQLAKKRESLPDFHFYNQDLSPFTAESLSSEIPVCIFYYNADCEHCQYEATALQKNIDAFRHVQVLMISTNHPEQTKRFADTYKLSGINTISWVYDKDLNFYKWFGKAVAPSVYIYGSKHQLLKIYRGEVKIETVLKHLRDDQKS